MAGPSVPKGDLPAEAIALGTLAGLLVDRGASVEVNTDWFANPVAKGGPSLADAGTRLPSLVAFVADMLTAVAAPPQVFDGARWYAIPGVHVAAFDPADPNKDTLDAEAPMMTLAVVAPAASADSGQIGFGVMVAARSGNVDGEVYAYLPLFAYDRSGTQPVVGRSDHPARIGLRLASVDGNGFAEGATTFKAVGVGVNLPFDTAAYARGGLIALEFEDLSGADRPARYTTLASIDEQVESWIGAALGQATTWFDRSIGQTPVRIADLLIGAGLLEEPPAPPPGGKPLPYKVDLSVARTETPLEIVLGALLGALDALAEADYPAVELPGGGIFFLRREEEDGSVKYELPVTLTDYGMRVALEHTLTEGGGGVPSGARPEVDIELGTWFTGETDDTSWIARSAGHPKGGDVEPGINVFALRHHANGDLSFAPSAALASVGLNVRGAGSAPLVDVGGFTLNGVELRAYLDYRGTFTFGAGMRLDDAGLSLAPKAGTPAQAGAPNPAAQTVIASGSTGAGDPTPVNPAMSLSAAWVEGGQPVVQVFDATGAPAQRVIIPIQRGLGPIMAKSLGIGWADDELSLALDGGIAIGGLSVAVKGLTIGVPITHPDDFSRYEFDLDGLGITFEAGSVDLSAAFVRIRPDTNATPPRPYTSYAGEALVKAGDYALSALGAYAYVPDPATGGGYGSLFIFAVLDGALGGPPFFYVTGVAGGFGYNRRLLLPEQDAVTTFPLVAAASDPTALGATRGPDGKLKPPDPTAVLTKLDEVVRPEHGQYWFAAGVRFTSFEVIQSTALLVVEFGNELEIALLGVASLTLPPAAAEGGSVPRLAYVELGIEVKLLPAAGSFTATAVLTPNSFVIDPACKLTGGFAFYVWFGDNQHAGEFVLTVGGYHPSFTPPDYYPRVPKLGFNWPVGGGVNISGDVYFALTPSAAMAGGGLRVLYESGNLRAWFRAEMNALVEWAPLHYELTIDVSLGASYRAHLLFVTATLSIELGAQLSLTGPPTGGTARINWFVISLTVGFGAEREDPPPPLEWRNAAGTGFAQRLIPDDAAAATPRALEARAADPAPAASAPRGGVYSVAVNGGLLTTFQDGPDTVWVVRRDSFAFSAMTAIPATDLVVGSSARIEMHLNPHDEVPGQEPYFVCVRPMKATLSSSTLTVGLSVADGKAVDLGAEFEFQSAKARVPAAKWGRPLKPEQSPEPNEMLDGRLVGIEGVRPRAPELSPTGDQALDLSVADALRYDAVDRVPGTLLPEVPLDPHAQPVRPRPQAIPNGREFVHDTLMSDDVVDRRTQIYRALQQFGTDPGADGRLDALAADPESYLTAEPLLTFV